MNIWKYDIAGVPGVTVLNMPRGARLLTAQLQHGKLQLWAMADPDAPNAQRTINVFGTGPTFATTPGVFLATFQKGPFAWHVFDGGES